MSNFSIFSKEYLQTLLDPFAPGMAEHVTPIKYEALTPDAFLLLFRTTAQDGQNHYFVSLESDYIDSLEGAKCTIVGWHGEVVNFWSANGAEPTDDTTSELGHFSCETLKPYMAVLAEVKRPTHAGYWANAIIIMPGDNIGQKIKHYTQKQQTDIRKTLISILQHKVDPSTSFIESFQAKQLNTMTDDINQTDLAVSIYVQTDGKVDYFYNYVHPTIGGKEHESPSDKN